MFQKLKKALAWVVSPMGWIAAPLAWIASPIYRSKNFGHYSYQRIGFLRYHVTSNSKIIRTMFTKHEEYPSPRFVKKTLAKLAGDSVGIAEGRSWKVARDAMMKNFSRTNVKTNIDPIIVEECEAMLDRWAKKAGQPMDFEREILDATGAVITRNILGDSLSREKARELVTLIGDTMSKIEEPDSAFGRLLKKILPYNHVGFMFGIALRALGIQNDYSPNPPKGLLKGADKVDAIIYSAIQERRKPGKHSNDLLGVLMETVGHHGRRYDDKELRDQILMLVVAGHETTSGSLTFAMDEILKASPDVQTKLRAEFNAVSDRGDVEKFPYAENCFNEAIRMHPAIGTTSREPIGDTVVNGVKFRKNDLVKLDIKTMQNRPDIWKDPEVFKPERFEDPSWPKHAYLPFGSGPRLCIGKDMAMSNGIIFLSRIFSRFNVKAEQHVEGERYFFTMRPKGSLKISVTPR